MWAHALESGKYPQTQQSLRDSKGLCCLGVLCDLHAQMHPAIAALETDPEVYMGEATVVPDEVRDWAGLEGDTGEFKGDKKVNGSYDLASLNDGLVGIDTSGEVYVPRHDFKQIAKIIRKHYKDL